jgi:hypothetical protein
MIANQLFGIFLRVNSKSTQLLPTFARKPLPSLNYVNPTADSLIKQVAFLLPRIELSVIPCGMEVDQLRANFS